MSNYYFSVNWFKNHEKIWNEILLEHNPSKILEIGSFEGASACYIIENMGKFLPLELHCIDAWDDSLINVNYDSDLVFKNFKNNTRYAIKKSKNKVDLNIHKGNSDMELSKLLISKKYEYFDLVYIDGSHFARDVLLDALLGFKLLKVGGFIFFDDYLWPRNVNIFDKPKFAIDVFTNIFYQKIQILKAPLQQLYVKKISN